MQTQSQHWWFSLGLCINLALLTPVYGHEGGGVSTKDLVRVALVANPSIPQFANAKGEGATQLVPLGPVVLQVTLP